MLTLASETLRMATKKAWPSSLSATHVQAVIVALYLESSQFVTNNAVRTRYPLAFYAESREIPAAGMMPLVHFWATDSLVSELHFSCLLWVKRRD